MTGVEPCMFARAAAIAAVVTVVMATPVWAHPGFRPSEVPAGQTTFVNLVIEHDCDGSPTTLVAAEVPAAILSAEPQPLDGWTITEDGSTGVVEWERPPPTAQGDAPVFGLEVTPDSQATEAVVAWRVYQECPEGSYRWGGGDAAEPSVDLTLTPGTLPSPNESAPSTATPAPAEASEASPVGEPTVTASPRPEESPLSSTETDADDNAAPWLPIALLLVAAGIAATAIGVRLARRV